MDRRQFLAGSGIVAGSLLAGCSGGSGGSESGATSTTTSAPTSTTDAPTTAVAGDGLVSIHFEELAARRRLRYLTDGELQFLEPEGEFWIQALLTVDNLGEEAVSFPEPSGWTLDGLTGFDSLDRINSAALRPRDPSPRYWRIGDYYESPLSPGRNHYVTVFFTGGRPGRVPLTADVAGSSIRVWPQDTVVEY